MIFVLISVRAFYHAPADADAKHRKVCQTALVVGGPLAFIKRVHTLLECPVRPAFISRYLTMAVD